MGDRRVVYTAGWSMGWSLSARVEVLDVELRALFGQPHDGAEPGAVLHALVADSSRLADQRDAVGPAVMPASSTARTAPPIITSLVEITTLTSGLACSTGRIAVYAGSAWY